MTAGLRRDVKSNDVSLGRIGVGEDESGDPPVSGILGDDANRPGKRQIPSQHAFRVRNSRRIAGAIEQIERFEIGGLIRPQS